jgi:hypothetical protein
MAHEDGRDEDAWFLDPHEDGRDEARLARGLRDVAVAGPKRDLLFFFSSVGSE